MKTISRIGMSLTALMMVVTLTGCGNASNNSPKLGQERVVETSRKDRPQWVEIRPKSDDQNVYFVGQTESGSSTGVRDAYQVGITRFSQALSTISKSIYESTLQSFGQEADLSKSEQFIRNISRNTVRGAEEKEIYWEKVEVIKPEGVKYYYRTYSMISVPKKSIEESVTSEINSQQTVENQQDVKTLEQVRKKLSAELDKLDKK